MDKPDKESYHDIKVTVDHDGTPAPQINVLLPPVTHLKQNTYN